MKMEFRKVQYAADIFKTWTEPSIDYINVKNLIPTSLTTRPAPTYYGGYRTAILQIRTSIYLLIFTRNAQYSSLYNGHHHV